MVVRAPTGKRQKTRAPNNSASHHHSPPQHCTGCILGIHQTLSLDGQASLTDIDPFPMPLEDSKRKVRGSESSNIRAACS